MKTSSFDEGDTVTSASIGRQQGAVSSVVAAGKIDMAALIEVHEETKHFLKSQHMSV
jgi:hypothetical protein